MLYAWCDLLFGPARGAVIASVLVGYTGIVATVRVLSVRRQCYDDTVRAAALSGRR